jgi:hypothetical protein
MLEVTAQRIVTNPEYQVFSCQVQLHGFNRLTPRAARAALEIAFGNSNYGDVWSYNFNHETGQRENEYGYRVYQNSARKIHSSTY